MEFKSYTSAELDSACFEKESAEYEKRKPIPVGLVGEVNRSSAGAAGCERHEVDEEDLCKAFAHKVGAVLQPSLVPGISLAEESLSNLHHRPAVYWLVAPPDAEHKHWHMVYVNYTENFHESWNKRERSVLKRAVAANCVLDWWNIKDEILQELITTALVYHFQPKWNLELPGDGLRSSF